MALTYPDRRNRYLNAAPWQVSAGVGRASNTPQAEPKSDLAKRERVPGEHFREVTTTVEPPVEAITAKVDTKVPETVKSASPTALAPTNIDSVLAKDGVEGSEG